ncbi:PAS domain-containing sensor histidine kinase [Mucilaginibacter conchicola]|uniref:histidine kinase n=1 Tax=Mucilaginibacter conchicola TaxID=2303333 RepID=A0A372NT17_9SPHI|nr:PAS domain-containing sensor histidine kinase [Mucilaginibacter conchicola]RFZ92420.1 PAS domain-containing sensor histidine kinase [Mucilaginibacter conchicola]
MSVEVAPYNIELFFELSADLLCIAGYDGYFKKINPAVSRTLGYTEEELFSRPINEFVHPDDQNLTQQHRVNLHKRIPLLDFENRYLTKSGETVWLSWTSMPDDDSQTVYAIAKNITHKKKVEDDRNTLIKNLTALNSDLKQLTYATSHNMRSPVNNLITIFNMLDRSKIQDDETLEFIEVMQNAAGNLRETLNGYVDGLTDKTALRSTTVKVNVGEALDEVSRSVSSLIESSGATLVADFTMWDVVDFNECYMESIFLNLITNSIKYAKPGVKPEMRIRTDIVNGQKQLIFEDNGLGFDMEQVGNKLFGLNQKFNYNEDSKGIGLYLVHTHITSLGGSITLDSQPGKGAAFTLHFRG